jgi:hypothetical protein
MCADIRLTINEQFAGVAHMSRGVVVLRDLIIQNFRTTSILDKDSPLTPVFLEDTLSFSSLAVFFICITQILVLFGHHFIELRTVGVRASFLP